MISSNVEVFKESLVIFSLGILNLLIDVNCQSAYREEGEHHSVCSRTKYHADILANLNNPVARKILQLENKLQDVTEKASVQPNNIKVKASYSTKECEKPWKQFGNKCYLYSAGISLSFWDALSFCWYQGAIIAVPVDVNENEYVKEIARKAGKPLVWIGISDAHTEGQWLSYPMLTKIDQFTDWGPGEPNGGADCGNLYYYHAYQWNDTPCNETRPFICEKLV